MLLVRFIHVLGFVLWLGGGIAGFVVAVGAREENPEVYAGAHRLLSRIHTMVIGLGALLTVVTGLILTMRLVTSGASAMMASPHIWVMQGAGLLGGLLVLFVGVPTAVRMNAAAAPTPDGTLPPVFEVYRKRQAIVSSVAGVLALIALFASIVLR